MSHDPIGNINELLSSVSVMRHYNREPGVDSNTLPDAVPDKGSGSSGSPISSSPFIDYISTGPDAIAEFLKGKISNSIFRKMTYGST